MRVVDYLDTPKVSVPVDPLPGVVVGVCREPVAAAVCDDVLRAGVGRAGTLGGVVAES